MGLDIKGIVTNIVDIIKANNTTTSSYNISSSLSSGHVQSVTAGIDGAAEATPVLAPLYPTIFVELASDTEAPAQMGSSANRQFEIHVNVVPVTDYGTGQEGGREIADKEIMQLTQNLKTLFRNYPNLSATVDSCMVEDTTYGVKFFNNTWNGVSRIGLKIKTLRT